MDYAPAYLIKVLADRRCHDESDLRDRYADGSLVDDADMKKALRFSSEDDRYQQIIDRVQAHAGLIAIADSIGL